MTKTDPLARLRSLLHDSTAPPAAQAARLAEERARIAGEDAVAHELVAADLRWMLRQDHVSASELGEAVEAARREWLELRVRDLESACDATAGAAFDLADIRAEALRLDILDLAGRCDTAIRRCVEGAEVDARLHQEAGERVAVLTATVEETPLADQIFALRANSEVMLALARKSGDKVLRRYGKRLGRLADDRELALRLERLIRRRGVVVLETVNFVLLLAVLTILVVEFTVDLSEGVALTLRWVDALACSFFIAAFLFEFVMHPRRGSWFLRNVITDLLPAIPSALFLVPMVDVPGAAGDVVVIRTLRVLRVAWAARYVQLLRPLLRSFRLLLFLVRGMDGLVQRFTQLLDREFVFVPAVADEHRGIDDDERRDALFAALQRERELLDLLHGEERYEALLSRAERLRQRMAELGVAKAGSLRVGSSKRDVPIDRAIEVLWSLRPQDVGRFLSPSDVRALDRVLRVVSAVPVRWLPLIRPFAVHPLPPTSDERVVALSRRVADWLEGWHGRLLFHADLHGIVTGPQILDRVATAMIRATQRPAVRLMLFGGLFLLFDQLFGWIPDFLSRTVAMPLFILGGIGLVGLAIGRWLKGVAGEAADAYRLTSEAHFLPQLELVKRRYEGGDLPFLARRVFDRRELADQAVALLRAHLQSARAGVPVEIEGTSEEVRLAANRIALLYLHFIDGAPLHITDVKTTEQLLANKAIENLREQFLGMDRSEKKRLRKLRLDDGSVFSGPYLWFSFITESIAVETAKRIEGYNRFCIPRDELGVASPVQREAMAGWLERRRDPKGGRTFTATESVRVDAYPTTEFCALDFVGADPERDRYIASIFGAEVLAVLQQDRRTMVREIFGTRPVHHLPKHERSFNPLRFYRRRMSHGRVLLAPLLAIWRFCRFVGWLVAKVRQIAREVLDPELAMQRREAGTAPFAVALRKIHRMKAPGLREALRMRLALDPAYSGAPCGWSEGGEQAEECDFERDLAFLHLRERECVELRDRAAETRQSVRELHAALAWMPKLPAVATERLRFAGEFAATCAWVADRGDVRTLLFAERWRAEHLPAMLRDGVEGSRFGDVMRSVAGLFRVGLVDRWLEAHARDLPTSARRILRRAWARDLHGIRRVIVAWQKLTAGESPADTAIARLREIYLQGPSVHRDVLALRAVQSMAVLDVRNYRDLVFQLGGYADDGEEIGEWCELP